MAQLSEWTRGIAGGAAKENGEPAIRNEGGHAPSEDTAAVAPPSERTPPEVASGIPAENGGPGGDDKGVPEPSKGAAVPPPPPSMVAGGVAVENGAAATG